MKAKYLWLLLLLPGLVGCETLGFYQQAVWGQWRILNSRVPLEQALADDRTDATTRDQLRSAQTLLSFAKGELQLPVADRYRAFVQLERDYVVWNVFAAQPYSLDAGYWCYPIVGCAPYRGYFNEEKAERAAARLKRRGMEIYVGGVPAYSTLGWFDDPLLSTFLHWPEADLANLLFHELAHGRVWVAGDTAFNESFASFVGDEGARLWFANAQRMTEWEARQARQQSWHVFRGFILQAKAMLEAIYAMPIDEVSMAARKAEILAAFQACYAANRAELGAGRYDRLMADNFNNAFLVSVGTYADWLPAFAEVFAAAKGDWGAFYRAVDEIAALAPDVRNAELERLAQKQVSHDADHRTANQINCKSFTRHGLDAETAG